MKKYGAPILGGWRGKSGDSRVRRGCFTQVGKKVSLTSFEQTFERNKRGSQWLSRVRTFQDKGIARAKAPRLECAGCVRGTARKSVWLEQRAKVVRKEIAGMTGNWIAEHLA